MELTFNFTNFLTSCKSYFNSFCTSILPHFSRVWNLFHGRYDGTVDIFKSLVSLIFVIAFLVMIYFIRDIFKLIIYFGSLLCSVVILLFRGFKSARSFLRVSKNFLFNKNRRWFKRWYRKPSYSYQSSYKKNYVNNYQKPVYQKKTINGRIPYDQYQKLEAYVLKKHGVNSFKGGKRK